ncbi:TIGR02757 family protein [Campylobacter sp. 19-13652]|uniref:TIGR02757 family protein n=1 Tax=Campylobacter sp. 19-13652 TaxID=2840180 RepID=UPI001C78FA86|nr:TIGR02757 family protein [Campylobacter sp. 19-13652]BCX79684.1 TIGR02757 family protein [Campylobacter sp. 19-13652]
MIKQHSNRLKSVLDTHLEAKSNEGGLLAHPDPLWVAREVAKPVPALACALFGYGNAVQIVKFLRSIDFDIINQSENEIKSYFTKHKYRFQNPVDVREIFITLARLSKDNSIEEIINSGLKQESKIEQGIAKLMQKIYSLNPHRSDGYEFFFGKEFKGEPSSPLKRYNMYLRWMVRPDDIDLGLFKSINTASLLLPLDVHTHRISLALGLGKRKSYDFKAALEITNKLREFDAKDPIKYDFALYRIGQGKELERVLEELSG